MPKRNNQSDKFEGMGKNNADCRQTHREVQKTMGTKTELVTVALVGLKLSLERHNRKHEVHWGWLVAETRYETAAQSAIQPGLEHFQVSFSAFVSSTIMAHSL